MMPATVASTSAATSRLLARKTANASSKSASVVARRKGMAQVRCRSSGMVWTGRGRGRAAVGMLRSEFDAPHRAQILHLGLDALDVEPDGAAVGKMQGDVAFRSGRRLEGDREQGQHQALVAEIDRLHLSTKHALEANGGAAAHV